MQAMTAAASAAHARVSVMARLRRNADSGAKATAAAPRMHQGRSRCQSSAVMGALPGFGRAGLREGCRALQRGNRCGACSDNRPRVEPDPDYGYREQRENYSFTAGKVSRSGLPCRVP